MLDTDDIDNGGLEAFRRSKRLRNDNKSFQIKDIIMILLFLMGIAAIYINVNERLIKLETKGEILGQQVLELKGDLTRAITKVEDSLKTTQSQLRDLEQLVIMSKPKPEK